MSSLVRDPEIEAGVDKWIENTHIKSLREFKPNIYHTSDFCGFGYNFDQWCPRAVYLKYKMGQEVYNRTRAGVFERGRTYELKVGEGILPEIGWIITEKQHEETYKDPSGISIEAHLDFLAYKDDPVKDMSNGTTLPIRHIGNSTILDYSNKNIFVMETKSTNFSSRDVFERFCIEPAFPKPAHVLQANFYAWLMNKPYKLIYVSIGDMSVRGWTGYPDANLAKTVIDRAKDLHKYIKGNEVPDGKVHWMCDFSQRTKPQTYCPFFNECRLMGDYGLHPAIYGYCVKEKMIVPEADENGQSLLLVDDKGRLICPSCGERCRRSNLTSRVSDKIKNGTSNTYEYDPQMVQSNWYEKGK